MGRTRGFGRSEVARCWAGFASLGAGLIHFAVVREHLSEWWLFGAFFIAIGVLQVGWAALALARDRAPFPRAVAGVNAAVIALWVVTRTVGLPVGPERWTPEAFGVADAVSAALEATVIVLLLAAVRLTREARARPSQPAAGARLALLGIGALAMAAVTTPALAATEAGEHAHPHGEHGTSQHDDGPGAHSD